MDKFELNAWSAIVSGNYTILYSGGDKAEKGVAVLLRNDLVKRLKLVIY